MKVAVQFTIDEDLLAQIDRDPEVAERGRSAFLRRAAEEYLRRRFAERIGSQYRRAYEKPPFPDDFGAWPPDPVEWPAE